MNLKQDKHKDKYLNLPRIFKLGKLCDYKKTILKQLEEKTTIHSGNCIVRIMTWLLIEMMEDRR